jgi:hypothetical protein
MKPFQTGTIIAAWLFRITLLWFVYEHYLQDFPGFDLKSYPFYMHTAYILFAVLLVAGGFMQKPGLTVLSGLAVFVLPIVQLIHSFPGDPIKVALLYLLPISIGFYFFTSGNGN